MSAATAEQLPAVLQSLGQTLASLPAALIPSVDVSQLDAQLNALVGDLEPVLPSLSEAQQESLLTNATWVSANLAALDEAVATIPSTSRAELSHADLVDVIKIGATRFSVMTVWAPELWAVLFMFCIVIYVKIALMFALKASSVRRVKEAREAADKVSMAGEVAAGLLAKPARSVIAHTLNFISSTICLGLQLAAWRLFVLPDLTLRFDDVQYNSLAIKILLVTYGCELLFAPVNWEIYLHHLMTFLLLLVGECSVFWTHSPMMFKMCQWLICQATLEQTTYLGMALYHASSCLRLQDHRPRLQKRFLRLAWILMEFTKYYTWPQKLVPAAVAFYWLARMWSELQGSMWGRAWCGWSVTLMSALVLLQIKFMDDVTPLAAHIKAKLTDTRSKSRTGPVVSLMLKLMKDSAKGSVTLQRQATDVLRRTRSRANSMRSEKAMPSGSNSFDSEEKTSPAGGAYPSYRSPIAVPATGFHDMVMPAAKPRKLRLDTSRLNPEPLHDQLMSRELYISNAYAQSVTDLSRPFPGDERVFYVLEDSSDASGSPANKVDKADVEVITVPVSQGEYNAHVRQYSRNSQR